MVSPAVQQYQHYPYLISKRLDPLFAISMGVAAYYLYEKREGRKPGHTLNELVVRKYHRWKDGKEL